VTAAEIHEVLPFDNTIVVVRVTGADLLDIARSIMARGREGRGLIFTSGMDFVFGPGVGVQVLIDGRPVDPGRELTMALSSFLAEGGDGHPPLARLTRVRELDGTCADVFGGYLRGLDELVVDRRSRTRWVEGSPLLDPSPKSATRHETPPPRWTTWTRWTWWTSAHH
jgi:5'-nucleotidase